MSGTYRCVPMVNDVQIYAAIPPVWRGQQLQRHLLIRKESRDLINDIEDCHRSLQNSQEADQSEESIREISETRRLQECLEKMKHSLKVNSCTKIDVFYLNLLNFSFSSF